MGGEEALFLPFFMMVLNSQGSPGRIMGEQGSIRASACNDDRPDKMRAKPPQAWYQVDKILAEVAPPLLLNTR